MKVSIVTMGIGHWYPLGVARMIQAFQEHSPGFEIKAWVNALPPGAPESVVVDGYDYTAYCAKPFAMWSALAWDADVVIWLDASVRPIRHIQPLVDHICNIGYYMAPTGFTIGEWASDESLEAFDYKREDALKLAECASG